MFYCRVLCLRMIKTWGQLGTGEWCITNSGHTSLVTRLFIIYVRVSAGEWRKAIEFSVWVGGRPASAVTLPEIELPKSGIRCKSFSIYRL